MAKLLKLNEGLCEALPLLTPRLPENYEITCKEALDKAKTTSENLELAIKDVYGFRAAGNLIRESIARTMVKNSTDNINLDDFIKPSLNITTAELFEPRKIAFGKVMYLKSLLDKRLVSGSMKTKDILDELQPFASTDTIYRTLHQHFQQHRYGEWGLKTGSL